jgi:predicted transcriptional regulator
MKLKTARLVIESRRNVTLRWAKAMKGRFDDNADVEVISFNDWNTLARIISPPRLEILAAIPSSKPRSISALAKMLGRDFKNVQADVHFLASIGLIDLRKGGVRNSLLPRAKFEKIEITWTEIHEPRPARKTA